MTDDVRTLARSLGCKTAAARSEAAWALAELGEQAAPAAVALVKAAGDEDEDVRGAASEALAELGPPPVRAARQLADLLTHEDPNAGLWAAILLGRLGENGIRYADALLDQAKNESAFMAVRERCLWSLAEVGPKPKHRPDLEVLARDPPRRLAKAAKQTLAAVPDE